MGGEQEIVSHSDLRCSYRCRRLFLAISAWTYTDDVTSRDHARKAVHFWTVIVERTGSSRFDIEEARERLSDAQQVLR